MKILPGLSAVVGRTDAEAQENYEYLNSLIHPDRRARNPLDGARQRRSFAISVRRAAAGEPAALEREPAAFSRKSPRWRGAKT